MTTPDPPNPLLIPELLQALADGTLPFLPSEVGGASNRVLWATTLAKEVLRLRAILDGRLMAPGAVETRAAEKAGGAWVGFQPQCALPDGTPQGVGVIAVTAINRVAEINYNPALPTRWVYFGPDGQLSTP